MDVKKRLVQQLRVITDVIQSHQEQRLVKLPAHQIQIVMNPILVQMILVRIKEKQIQVALIQTILIAQAVLSYLEPVQQQMEQKHVVKDRMELVQEQLIHDRQLVVGKIVEVMDVEELAVLVQHQKRVMPLVLARLPVHRWTEHGLHMDLGPVMDLLVH